jgi:hypothetical protein
MIDLNISSAEVKAMQIEHSGIGLAEAEIKVLISKKIKASNEILKRIHKLDDPELVELLDDIVRVALA